MSAFLNNVRDGISMIGSYFNSAYRDYTNFRLFTQFMVGMFVVVLVIRIIKSLFYSKV